MVNTLLLDMLYFFFSLGSASCLFFVLSGIFYLLCCCMNPGYVKQEFGIVDILQIANDKQIDMENFCFYCRTIKSQKAFHCMFCKCCVERFDHHCAYINNCLGHRNHKFFILFLVCILIYFLTSSTVSIAGLILTLEMDDSEGEILTWFTIIYTISINALECIPLCYQIVEQTKRLCKPEIINNSPDNTEKTATSRVSPTSRSTS